jgi:hypothetical protein
VNTALVIYDIDVVEANYGAGVGVLISFFESSASVGSVQVGQPQVRVD